MRVALAISLLLLLIATVAAQHQVQAPGASIYPEPPVPPPEAQQLFVWFIPSACNAPCGTHWVYLLWRDGGLWRRLCTADDCGPWEAL